jgi:hypothetical protein
MVRSVPQASCACAGSANAAPRSSDAASSAPFRLNVISDFSWRLVSIGPQTRCMSPEVNPEITASNNEIRMFLQNRPLHLPGMY